MPLCSNKPCSPPCGKLARSKSPVVLLLDIRGTMQTVVWKTALQCNSSVHARQHNHRHESDADHCVLPTAHLLQLLPFHFPARSTEFHPPQSMPYAQGRYFLQNKTAPLLQTLQSAFLGSSGDATPGYLAHQNYPLPPLGPPYGPKTDLLQGPGEVRFLVREVTM